MSDDEILFDDVTYRQPQRLRRPDLDRRWTCIAYEVPQPDDLPVFLDRKPADAIERHALRDTSVELGGILLGKECIDSQSGQPFVWITDAIEAKHYENTQASFTYTHDSWEEITRERDQIHPDLDIVGWYHTHPDFGVFLSSHDLFIHHHFFSQPLQLAYVVDPIRQTRGFFQWRAGSMDQVGGFYLIADRADRLALARLVNDLECIPNLGGGGGSGLSPRLEAELIAMLARPQYQAPAADRAQTAGLFAMIGMFVGALAVGGLFWLQAMSRSLHEQSEAVKDLAKTHAVINADHAKSIDAERSSAKEAALDALLKDIRVGSPPEKFLNRYTDVVQQRDAAVHKIATMETQIDALADQSTTLKDEHKRLQTELAAQKQRAEQEKNELKTTLDQRETKLDQLTAELDEKTRIMREAKSGLLDRKYTWAFYAAVAGWAAFLLCAIGLGTLVTRDQVEPDPGSQETNPHVIAE